MTGAERLERMYRRAGLDIVAPEALAAPAASEGGVLISRADWVYDESLIKALAQRPGGLLVAPNGTALAAHVTSTDASAAAAALAAGENPSARVAGLTPLDRDELAYNQALRKREPPVLEPLTSDNVGQVERRTFQGSYKGVTDIVTKYLWPAPARVVTRWCALARMTPNQVTTIGFLLVLAAFWLFWNGHYGWGLACGWVMTFLDTVDGKLARVTMTSSKWGNVFDHGIDLVHPPFWWWAWWVGLSAVGQPVPYAGAMLAVVLVGYVVQRILEGIFMRAFGFHVHAWRPFDSWFRLITARRNPNLILLTGTWLLGRPDVGFAAIALWTALSLLVHLAQLVQAFATPKAKVTSWLSR
ncbi:CDP-alcohol phosphatidyltransferase family protein [Phenylobacterium deserti]|uniref:CDP-alcohol phosphatidyltransferase family protein n=2 Tax=Phenylobacterium deserti TaxID=1914756 RepID=A0A328AET7_9CAUL|nr:CDP-alcohol phosphatidyltransferase family protein [Phenylobacterium deserti]